jgi:hypothetical protein
MKYDEEKGIAVKETKRALRTRVKSNWSPVSTWEFK